MLAVYGNDVVFPASTIQTSPYPFIFSSKYVSLLTFGIRLTEWDLLKFQEFVLFEFGQKEKETSIPNVLRYFVIIAYIISALWFQSFSFNNLLENVAVSYTVETMNNVSIVIISLCGKQSRRYKYKNKCTYTQNHDPNELNIVWWTFYDMHFEIFVCWCNQQLDFVFPISNLLNR